jgi:uncharacterized membrane protein
MAVFGIVALWVAFAATHMGMSSLKFRPRLVAALGERGFQGVYSLVALATFVPLVWVYLANKHAGPHFWYLGQHAPVRWIAYLGIAASLVLLVGGFLNPSPASLAPGKGELRGALRITRHPVFMAIGLFGLMHLVTANSFAAEFCFFGGLAAFAWLGSRHQDQRKLATLGEDYRRFCEATPFAPFTRGGWPRGLAEMPLAIGLGIALTVVLRYFHPAWFGGAP